MEEESILDVNNITPDTFSHTPTRRENANVIFTSENIDKSDKLADTIKDLTINNARYYASKSVTASDSQSNLTRDLETVTHTSNGKEKVTDTINRDFEKNY